VRSTGNKKPNKTWCLTLRFFQYSEDYCLVKVFILLLTILLFLKSLFTWLSLKRQWAFPGKNMIYFINRTSGLDKRFWSQTTLIQFLALWQANSVTLDKLPILTRSQFSHSYISYSFLSSYHYNWFKVIVFKIVSDCKWHLVIENIVWNLLW
jgi:hypothetical protein